MAEKGLEETGLEASGSQPVDLKQHPSGIVPTLQSVIVPAFFITSNCTCLFQIPLDFDTNKKNNMLSHLWGLNYI